MATLFGSRARCPGRLQFYTILLYREDVTSLSLSLSRSFLYRNLQVEILEAEARRRRERYIMTMRKCLGG